MHSELRVRSALCSYVLVFAVWLPFCWYHFSLGEVKPLIREKQCACICMYMCLSSFYSERGINCLLGIKNAKQICSWWLLLCCKQSDNYRNWVIISQKCHIALYLPVDSGQRIWTRLYKIMSSYVTDLNLSVAVLDVFRMFCMVFLYPFC